MDFFYFFHDVFYRLPVFPSCEWSVSVGLCPPLHCLCQDWLASLHTQALARPAEEWITDPICGLGKVVPVPKAVGFHFHSALSDHALSMSTALIKDSRAALMPECWFSLHHPWPPGPRLTFGDRPLPLIVHLTHLRSSPFQRHQIPALHRWSRQDQREPLK